MIETATQVIAPEAVALITAGASGIGRVIAEAFLDQDCRVHVCDSDPAAIESFLQENPKATATLANAHELIEQGGFSGCVVVTLN